MFIWFGLTFMVYLAGAFGCCVISGLTDDFGIKDNFDKAFLPMMFVFWPIAIPIALTVMAVSKMGEVSYKYGQKLREKIKKC